MPALIALIRNHLAAIAWSVTLTTLGLAWLVWATSNNWQIIGISLYRLFPGFGLTAFSVMWSQYVVLALAQYAQAETKQLERYFAATGGVVIIALLLHPGLLIYQLWRDGFGLPPGSILHHFVAPGLGWVALLGIASWFVFMTYGSLNQTFGSRRWWRWVLYAGDLAMLAVFYHGFRLGDQLQGGWFRWVWLGYGAVLVVTILYSHKDELRRLAMRIKG